MIPSILDCVLYLIHFVKCNILVLNIDIVHSEENTTFNICSIKRCKKKTPKENEKKIIRSSFLIMVHGIPSLIVLIQQLYNVWGF